MSKKAIFAGTFDPFTKGHYDLVKRASAVFDEVIVAVAGNGTVKRCVATPDQRVEIAKKSLVDIQNARVEVFDGLLTDFAKAQGAEFLIRGVRNCVDFEYEKNLYSVYKSIDSNIEVFYLISSSDYGFISSSLVREILSLDGNVDAYICSEALDEIKELYRK